MAMHERKTIELEQGWEFMQKGITKLKNILEGLPEPQFTCEDYMKFYTTIYNMCTQKLPHDYSQQLYDKYKEPFEEYISSTVLPSLREKHDEFMLRELVKRWLNHKIMVRWLSRFFHYLDSHFIARRSLPTLNEVGLTCFRDLVYNEIKVKVRDSVISLIDQEREGEQIDRALLKNVLDIFVEIGLGNMECYENDFEAAMLEDTATYYSRKASNWILEDSCPDYMLKAEECLKREKDRVSHYLHSSSEPKLLERVQHELLSVNATQLLEKEHSGCPALLRDDKHVTAEGTASVKQAEDAASNKKAIDRGEKLNELAEKTTDLRSQAQDFRKQGTKIGKKLWFHNMKIKLVILGILVLLVLIIWASICQGFNCTKQEDGNSYTEPLSLLEKRVYTFSEIWSSK